MENIRIKGVRECADLDRKVFLQNGAIVVQKEGGQAIGAYLVIPFRDHKNRYPGGSTTAYCALVDLDTGKLAFEERCSRATTERRVLRHLTRAGFSYPYDPDSREQDAKFYGMRVQVYMNGCYKMEIELGEEYMAGRKRKGGGKAWT